MATALGLYSCRSGEIHMRRSKQREPKRVTEADKQIGQRIAAFRKMKGMSQGYLGEAVGVTFQQIQKYENGTNRASAGRLQQIAGALGVPLSAFFDAVSGEDGPVPSEVLAKLREPGAAALLRAYVSIGSADLRRSLLQTAQELAGAASRTARPAVANASTSRRPGSTRVPR